MYSFCTIRVFLAQPPQNSRSKRTHTHTPKKAHTGPQSVSTFCLCSVLVWAYRQARAWSQAVSSLGAVKTVKSWSVFAFAKFATVGVDWRAGSLQTGYMTNRLCYATEYGQVLLLYYAIYLDRVVSLGVVSISLVSRHGEYTKWWSDFAFTK